MITWSYVLFYAMTRFTWEFFRDDWRGSELFDAVSISQAIAVVLAILAVCASAVLLLGLFPDLLFNLITQILP